jgi:hypothetical protein
MVLTTCHTFTRLVSGRRRQLHRCAVRLVAPPAGFRSIPTAKVRLTRPGRTYATGSIQRNGVVVLQTLHTLLSGRKYTLTLSVRNAATHYTIRLL